MASIYIFGVLGRNDVRILTLISIGVVGGLHQEVGVGVFAILHSCEQAFLGETSALPMVKLIEPLFLQFSPMR